MVGNSFAGKPFHDAVPFARELIEAARSVGRRLPTPQRQMDAERRGSRGSLRAVRRRRLAPQNPGGQPEPTLLVRREARLTKEINEVGPESLTPTPLFLLGNHYGDAPLNSQYRKTAPTLFFCRSGRLHLLPYRGGLAHLSVHGRWRRLVDHRVLTSLDLDFPFRCPLRHLVVREVTALR